MLCKNDQPVELRQWSGDEGVSIVADTLQVLKWNNYSIFDVLIITIEIFVYLFVCLFVCCVCVFMLQWACGVQRITCGSRFSPPCGFWGLNSDHQTW